MADYRRIATGNWSNLAQWQVYDTNTLTWIAATQLPGINDVVQANSYTTTLDIDVAVSEFRNSGGGRFEYGAGVVAIGNCYNSSLAGGVVRNPTSDIKYFIGDSYAGNGSQVYGLANVGSGVIIQTGNANGGTGAMLGTNGSGGTANTSSGSVIINGNVFGNGSGNCGAFNRDTATGSITINGTCQGTSGFGNLANVQCFVNTVIGSSVTSALAIVEVVNLIPSITPTLIRLSSNGTYQTFLSNNNPITLTAAPNYPDETDVRDGVTYGPANIYEGNLETGITANDLFDAIENSSHPIAERLRNVSTEQTTGAQIASAVT